VILLGTVATLQVAVVQEFAVVEVKPDLFLILVILVAMREGSAAGTLWGLAAGAVQDSLSGGMVGFHLLSKPVTGLAIGLLRDKLDFENPNTQSVVTFAATLAEGLFLSVLLSAYHPGKSAVWSLSHIVLPLAVYNALLMPIVVIGGRMAHSLREELRRRESKLAE
jgi:rod shape-determining protein MreD